jgi:tetratricopeptide (TPR) repeat protein
LAKLYSKSERYGEAEEQWKAVVHLRKNTLGSSHKDTMEAMIALGLVYAECQRYDDAEGLWKEVIGMSKGGNGSFGRLRIKAMESLAKMNQNRGQNEGAVEWWKESIALRREMQNRLQGETPNALDHLKLLYNTFSNCDTYADIEEEGYGQDDSDSDSAFGDPEMTDALDKMMAPDNNEFFTPDSKGVLSAIHSLGKVYMKCGKYEEAEALLSTAVQKKIDGFDDDDSGINDMLENLLEEARDNLIPTLGVDMDATDADREEEAPVGDEGDGQAQKKSVRESVREMFPSVDIGVIDIVLEAQGGDGDATINVLLDMLVGD